MFFHNLYKEICGYHNYDICVYSDYGKLLLWVWGPHFNPSSKQKQTSVGEALILTHSWCHVIRRNWRKNQVCNLTVCHNNRDVFWEERNAFRLQGLLKVATYLTEWMLQSPIQYENIHIWQKWLPTSLSECSSTQFSMRTSISNKSGYLPHWVNAPVSNSVWEHPYLTKVATYLTEWMLQSTIQYENIHI